jgi:tetratricopeptide (TPR) repeat protein
MRIGLNSRYLVTMVLFGACALSPAQTSKAKPADIVISSEKGVQLAQSGRCAEALPILKRAAQRQIDAEMKRRIGLATLRCAMTLDDRDAVADAIKSLNHSFPNDPEVLYISTHAYSDLASRESLDLARKAPDSSQAHEMQAEALETQGKWNEAAKEYRLILERFPNLPGIHFRLGRLLLSQPNPPPDMAEQAQKEFEAELKINPNNAGAEYILGQIAQQSQSWDAAQQHYSRAARLDPQFGEAYLGLGVSLISLKRYSEAIAPLEAAVKLQPGNPDAHYRLATAYTRTGRKQDADKEFAIHGRLVGTQGGAAPQTTPANPSPDNTK